MKRLLENFPTNESIDEVKSDLTALRTKVQEFAVPLTQDDRKKRRKMADGREGIVRKVDQIAQTYINTLAREIDPAELSQRLNVYSQLQGLQQLNQAIGELLEDTLKANAIDIMTVYDRVVQNLGTARNDNADLDQAMKEIDDYNSRFGSPAEEAAEPDGDNTPET